MSRCRTLGEARPNHGVIRGGEQDTNNIASRRDQNEGWLETEAETLAATFTGACVAFPTRAPSLRRWPEVGRLRTYPDKIDEEDHGERNPSLHGLRRALVQENLEALGELRVKNSPLLRHPAFLGTQTFVELLHGERV